MALTKIDPPGQRVDFFGIGGQSIDWSPHLADEDADPRTLPRNQFRPHQVKAFNDVIKGFQANDRDRLVMACGTGKTLTALRIAEQVAGECFSPRLPFPYRLNRCGGGERTPRFPCEPLPFVLT